VPAATTRDPNYFYLPDGTHPDTLVQGIIANAFLAAANLAYGTNLTPLTNTEILANAGLTPDGSWDGVNYDASPFAFAPVPEPTTAVLLGLGLGLGLAGMAMRGRRLN